MEMVASGGSYPRRVALARSYQELLDQIDVYDGCIDGSSITYHCETIALTVWRIAPARADVRYRRIIWPLVAVEEGHIQSVLRVSHVENAVIPDLQGQYDIITDVHYEPDDRLLTLELAASPPIALRIRSLYVEIEEVAPPTDDAPCHSSELRVHWGRLRKNK